MRISKRMAAFALTCLLLLGALSGAAAATAPRISSLSPERGPVGATVRITGRRLAGTTSVSFGGVSADFHINSRTLVTATVPRHATTGRIRVKTPAGTAVSPDRFAVQPNIVLILTDDQRYDEMTNMPNVRSGLARKGMTFTNGFVVNPLCCPSRTTILTGKYSHGTDVYDNNPPHGGFETFMSLGEENSTIATWLQGVGYETALVGKYLNGYSKETAAHVPPGWSTWDGLTTGGGGGGYYHYVMSVNGKSVKYGSTPRDYSTDVLSGYATRFIKGAPANRPLFLYFAPKAPHDPATPPVRYENSLTGTPRLRLPNFNEADVSDKPPYIQALPPMDRTAKRNADATHIRHLQTLLAVDDAVGNILAALKQSGRLGDTLLLFASDNGVELGSHRWRPKMVPYEESVRAPIVVRYDPVTQKSATTSDSLALNLDFAPTFADAGGAPAPDVEGSSLMPLLTGNTGGWRSDFLIEHANAVTGPVPAYCAVRSAQYKYVKYEDGFEELYDLRSDPYELDNLLVTKAGDPGISATRDQMYARLLQLCSPPPPGFTP